jgi:CHAT domain-containing protein
MNGLLARATTGTRREEQEALDTATQIAKGLAEVWGDSFPLRIVQRFARLSPANRASKVRADSLRRAGNEALSRDGPQAAVDLWRRGLTEAAVAGDSAGVAAVLGNIGAGFYAAGDLDSATVYLERSRRLAGSIGDDRTVGNVLGSLGNIAKARGRLREAQRLYGRASGVRERVGDTRGVAADLNNLGLVSEALGELDSAAGFYRRAMGLNQRYGRQGPQATNLLNLANLASLRGEYATAEEEYAAALAIREARGEQPAQANVRYNLGVLASRRGAYEEAAIDLRRALTLYQATGLADGAVATLVALSNLHAVTGAVEEASRELRRAEQLAEGSGLGEDTRAELAFAGAELALAFNDLPEAERHYAHADTLYHETHSLAGQAAVAEGLGLLFLRRDQLGPARDVLEQAVELRSRSGDSRGAAMTRLLQGYARQQSGDLPEADEAFASARATFRSLDDRVGEAAALEAIGNLEAVRGRTAKAEARYSAGLRRLGTTSVPVLSWNLRAGLAEAQRRRGALDEAAGSLHAAVDELERVGGELTLEEKRTAYLADKWTVFGQLVLLELRRGRTEIAFEVSERMRARQMLDQLSRGRIQTAGIPQQLSSREQDLRHRIMELALQVERGQLGRSGQREASTPALSTHRAEVELARAQDAYARLLLEIREVSPGYASLIGGATLNAREARGRLVPDELLLDYLLLDSAAVVFAITSDTLRAFELPVNRATLAGLVDFTRDLLMGTDAADPRELWRPPLRRLYQALLGPIEAAGLLQGKRRLIIVPHAELHYLPLAELLGGGSPGTFLIERFEISYAPSVSVWVRLGDRPRPRATGSILALAPRSRELSGSSSEVAGIRQLYGDRAVTLTDDAATERRFREMASRYEIVHLATYGVLNRRNPLFSFVQLHSDSGDDGRLEVHEVYGLDIRARLLVLSACETGLGAGALADVPEGDDWVGLVQAFLYAGAASVLATHWPVDDRATSTFMRAFYAKLRATGSPSTALAQAQRVFLHTPSSRSPFFWAGFTLSGGR